MKIRLFSFGSLAYLGLGFLIHLIFVGTTIVWSNAFALFVILLWPFYLIWLFMKVLFWIALVAGVCFLIYCAYCKITGRRI